MTLREFLDSLGDVKEQAARLGRSPSAIYDARRRRQNQGEAPFVWRETLLQIAREEGVFFDEDWIAPYRVPGLRPGTKLGPRQRREDAA
ncbi:MAG: hypothetical protein AAGM38_09890 [Pseudomonadota bacterium]